VVCFRIHEEERNEKITEIDAELDTLDKKYLTPRVLGGIALGNEYAISQRNKHELEAAPYREQREQLKKST